MVVYYFGADDPWQDQSETGIRRRNMALLSAIGKNEKVDHVYNVIRCTRKLAIRKCIKKEIATSKIKNIYIAPLFPERGFLKYMFRPLNRALLKLMNLNAFWSHKNDQIISWCYWPQGYEDYKYINLKGHLIFDTDHNIVGDPNTGKSDFERKKKILLEVAQLAKLIVSSSRSMLTWFNKLGYENTQLLLNGLVLPRINIKNIETSQRPYQITYCGTLSLWLQIDWLVRAIEENPDWQFNIIGKNYKTNLEQKLQKYLNVRLYGFLEPDAVDAILQTTDVCIGLYQRRETLDVNSMKLYDYLSQGCSVVVNNYHDHLHDDFNGLLNIASNYDQFCELIKNPKPLDPALLENFLKSATWDKRVEPLFSRLNG